MSGCDDAIVGGGWAGIFFAYRRAVASPNAKIVEMIRRAIPLKRWGKESDIADTALFLASPAASYITGTIIETDGGVTIASPEMSHFNSIEDLVNDPRVQRKPSK